VRNNGQALEGAAPRLLRWSNFRYLTPDTARADRRVEAGKIEMRRHVVLRWHPDVPQDQALLVPRCWKTLGMRATDQSGKHPSVMTTMMLTVSSPSIIKKMRTHQKNHPRLTLRRGRANLIPTTMSLRQEGLAYVDGNHHRSMQN
jgi:hypothetical protein